MGGKYQEYVYCFSPWEEGGRNVMNFILFFTHVFFGGYLHSCRAWLLWATNSPISIFWIWVLMGPEKGLESRKEKIGLVFAALS